MTKLAMYLNILTIATIAGLAMSAPLLANTRANTFIDNGNGSVSDTATGLTWQQQDDNVLRNHADAISYCQGLNLAGRSDWRLPNIKELITLVDYRYSAPSIDKEMFPNTNSSFYWSVSSWVGALGGDASWAVGFPTGKVAGGGNASTLSVRCVR